MGFLAAFGVHLAAVSGGIACSGEGVGSKPTSGEPRFDDDNVADPWLEGSWLEGQTHLLQLSLRLGADRAVEASAEASPKAQPEYRFVGSLDFVQVNMTAVSEGQASSCMYTRLEDYSKKVPDECCGVEMWSEMTTAIQQPAKPRSKEGRQYDCFVSPYDTGTESGWTRGYAGCAGAGDENIQYGNYCIPEGTSLGSGYPIESADAADSAWQDGTWASCGCGNQGQWATGPMEGAGCFVAFVPEQGVPDWTVFVKIDGTCVEK